MTLKTPPLTRFFMVFLAVALLGAATSAVAQSCPDLSGSFEFFGEWLSVTPEDQPHPQKQRPPTIDTYAFLYGVGQVIRPRHVRVSKLGSPGQFQIDILDAEQILPHATNLSISTQLVCHAGAWEISHAASGGGENTPSTVETHALLSRSSDGDLLVEGWQNITKGWIFKEKWSWQWKAVFRKQSLVQE